MANELTIPVPPGTALAGAYVQAFDAAGRPWNGTAFEAYLDAHWSLYAIVAARLGTSSLWMATFPPAIPAGDYSIVAYARPGAAPDPSDPPLAAGMFRWTGKAELPVARLMLAIGAEAAGNVAQPPDGSTTTIADALDPATVRITSVNTPTTRTTTVA